jgi:hypothetical protein
MQTPKQQFSKHPYHGPFYDLTASADFLTATNYAMLQLVHELRVSGDTNAAFANSYRIEGAKDFLRILLTLADPPTEKGPDPKPDPMQPAPYKPPYRSNK